MAKNTNRNVTLTLGIDTFGEENVNRLQQAVEELANEGGAAAPEFQKLADEIKQLGAQGQALKAFQTLTDESEKLKTQQIETANAAVLLTQKTSTLASSMLSAKTTEEAVRKARAETYNQLKKLEAEQQRYNATTSAENKKTAENIEAVEKRAKAIEGLKVKYAEQREAVRLASKESSDLNAQYRRLVSEQDKAVSASNKLNTELSEQTRLLEESVAAAKAMGVSTSDVAQSQAELVTALGTVEKEIKDRAKVARDAVEADKMLEQQARATIEASQKTAQALYQERMALIEAERAADSYAHAKGQMSDVEVWQRQVAQVQQAEHAYKEFVSATKEVERQLKLLETADGIKKLVTDSERLGNAAADVRLIALGLEQTEQKAREAAQATEQFNNALSSVGVRNIAQINDEIQQVRNSMQLLAASGQLTGAELRGAFAAGEQQIKTLDREIRELTGSLTMADKAADLFKNSMGQITAGNLIADGIGSVVETVKAMAREFVTANLEMDRLVRTMTVISGSAEGAAEKIKFLRDVANDAGQGISGITDSFIRFNASAMAAGMASEQVDEMFRAVTVNGSKMGMSTERVSLALEALGQMASKGVVSMEELRQQLGDSLPGAVAIAAKGLGLTTGELTKMVESGSLMTDQFFPAFLAGMKETFGSSDEQVSGLYQSFQRLRNALTQVYQQAHNSAPFKALEVVFDSLAANMQLVVDVTVLLGKAFLALKIVQWIGSLRTYGQAYQQIAVDTSVATTATTANTAATTANTVAKTANTAAVVANAAAQKTAATSLSTMIANLNLVGGATSIAARGFGVVATAVRGLIGLFGGPIGLAAVILMNRQQLVDWTSNAIGAVTGFNAKMRAWEAEEKQRRQEEAKRHEERMEENRQKVNALQREVAARNKEFKALEDALDLAGKETKTIEERAALSERMIALSGSEVDQAKKALETHNDRINAAGREHEVRNRMIAAAEEELRVRQALMKLSGNEGDKVKEVIAQLSQKVAKMKEEAAQSEINLRNMQAERVERELAVIKIERQTESVETLRAEQEKTAQVVEQLRKMDQDSLYVKENLIKAEADHAIAVAKYNAAVEQGLDAIKRKSEAETALLDTQIAGLKVQEAKIQTALKEAERTGDTRKAIELERQAREIRIKIMELELKLQEAQIAAKLKAIELERASLDGTDEATQARKEQLDIETQLLKTEQELLGVQKEAITQAKNSSAAADKEATSRKRNKDSIDGEKKSLSDLNDERERELELRRTADGFRTNADGSAAGTFNSFTTTDAAYRMIDRSRRGELQASDLEEARAAMEQARTAQEWLQATRRQGGSVSQEALSSAAALYAQMQRVLGEVELMARREQNSKSTSSSQAQDTDVTGQNSTGSTKTVNIHLGGRSDSINVASDADSQKLVALLRTLETDFNRS